MNYFISTETVENTYKELIKLDVKESSILHIFFILKACGFNKSSYTPTSNIGSKGFKPASMISSLFLPNEEHPLKHDFISPFSMDEWNKQSPSEPLKKWVKSRIKNNVIGGATTWRSFLDYDPSIDSIKFKYNYIEELKKLTLDSKKLNINAFSIWSQRFTPYVEKITLSQTVDAFKDVFNITDQENFDLFTHKNNVPLKFNSSIYDAAKIRRLIGPPDNTSDEWVTTRASTKVLNINTILEEIIMPEYNQVTDPEKIIKKLLDKYSQVILAGPPGTSKSYIAHNVASTYHGNNVVKIQFHPSYSYQDFIGGYVVEGTVVSWCDGVLYQFVEKAKTDPDNEYLLIIDEINRANVGQVFGETIQCLDRNNVTSIRRHGELSEFSLPKNIKIIGTMNTSDRTIGAIDFAIKRRFVTIYAPPNPALVDELCETDINISLGDFIRLINRRLNETLRNKELSIGHAYFMDIESFDSESNKHIWNAEDFELLFNYKILPQIEDYTRGNISQLTEIIGENLQKRLIGNEFVIEVEKLITDAG